VEGQTAEKSKATTRDLPATLQKVNWLSLNDFGCKDTFSTAKELLNRCQDAINMSTTYQKKKKGRAVMVSRFTFYDLRTLLLEHKTLGVCPTRKQLRVSSGTGAIMGRRTCSNEYNDG
jgi:hypothetical protein